MSTVFFKRGERGEEGRKGDEVINWANRTNSSGSGDRTLIRLFLNDLTFLVQPKGRGSRRISGLERYRVKIRGSFLGFNLEVCTWTHKSCQLGIIYAFP